MTIPNSLTVAFLALCTVALVPAMSQSTSMRSGVNQTNSARRVPIVGISGVAPVSDHFRFQGGFSANPPIPSLGKNQPATVGLSVTALYAWY